LDQGCESEATGVLEPKKAKQTAKIRRMTMKSLKEQVKSITDRRGSLSYRSQHAGNTVGEEGAGKAR